MTEVREWTTIDKAEWPSGPWDDEPDKVQWVDEATGLDCLIVRNHSGALCGYVGVSPEHPWHGKGYSECAAGGCDDGYCAHSPYLMVTVHGGLTYSASCMEEAAEGEGICHIPEPGRPADVWWLGFDTAHCFDLSPRFSGRYGRPFDGETYKDRAYVEGECSSLAAQVAAVAS